MTRESKLYISSVTLAALYAFEFFVTGIFIFEDMFHTFVGLPFILTFFALLPLVFSVLNLKKFRNARISVIVICAAVIMAIGHFLFAAYVLSKLTYLIITGLPVFAVAAIVGVFLFLILLYPRLSKLWKRVGVISLSVAIFFVCVFGVFRLTFFRFTSEGVVFAVEDEYQIAWSTSTKSTGYVTVNGKTYCDEVGGQNRISTLHKVSVPMSELDLAGGYTLHSVPVYSEAAYFAIRGGEHTREYSFRPVDSSDGLQIYNISDSHETFRGAGNAGRYFGDKLDILILNGDIINDVTSFWQISFIYKLAGIITEGTRPVIFTRGNHECNGRYADELPEYVASKDDNFYYTLKLGGAYFMVLDTNNDMTDDNFFIRPAANFELVRREQISWLEGLDDFGEDCEYHFLLAHMAFPLADYKRFPEWTAALNEATDGKFDLCISGHSHKLDYAEAGTETKTDYPVVRGSLRSDYRLEGEGVDPAAFTGTAIECKDGKITVSFTNSRHEVLEAINVN